MASKSIDPSLNSTSLSWSNQVSRARTCRPTSQSLIFGKGYRKSHNLLHEPGGEEGKSGDVPTTKKTRYPGIFLLMSSFGQPSVPNTSTKQTRVDVIRCVANTSKCTGTILSSFQEKPATISDNSHSPNSTTPSRIACATKGGKDHLPLIKPRIDQRHVGTEYTASTTTYMRKNGGSFA